VYCGARLARSLAHLLVGVVCVCVCAWRRNPLHALTDSANFIMETCKPEDEIYEDVSIIVSGALQMSRMLVSIMDWAKVSVGQLELRPSAFNIADMLRQLVRRCRLAASVV
jgi:hypothetical protein